MLKLLSLLLLSSSYSLVQAAPMTDRAVSVDFNPVSIRGGENAQAPLPWMVSLLYNNLTHQCGGSLIAEDFILTAAHCILDGKVLVPHSGRYNLSKSTQEEKGIKFKIIGQEVHQYVKGLTPERYSHLNDIALLHVKVAKNYSTSVLETVAYDVDPNSNYTGQLAELLGWGYTGSPIDGTSKILQFGEGSVISKSKYEEITRGYYAIEEKTQTAYISSKIETCGGDSGGPLYIKPKDTEKPLLLGIHSSGWGCSGVYGMPNTQTKVGAFSSWISEKMLSMRSEYTKDLKDGEFNVHATITRFLAYTIEKNGVYTGFRLSSNCATVPTECTVKSAAYTFPSQENDEYNGDYTVKMPACPGFVNFQLELCHLMNPVNGVQTCDEKGPILSYGNSDGLVGYFVKDDSILQGNEGKVEHKGIMPI